MNRLQFQFLILFVVLFEFGFSQEPSICWAKDGLGYYELTEGQIIKKDPKKNTQIITCSKGQLTPLGATEPLIPSAFFFNNDNSRLLIFTNTVKVWRYRTRGDYWVLDISKNQLKQLGKGLATQSLMFAKFSPDGMRVAYVSEHNIYVEDLISGRIKKLTTDGTRKLINGTFDWVYEEEFGSRDGFRWSPDGQQIAYWQVDANKIRDYYMLNSTDSVYNKIIPVEYPKVGESPSPVIIGVVPSSGGPTKWMKIEGDPQQHYITKMEWSDANELVIQWLDRKQQESKLIYCSITDGSARTFWAENDDAWIDLCNGSMGWNWINNKKDFLWISEKDGWRHVYKISRDGKNTVLLTKGNYDIAEIKAIDEANNYLYFSASPNNANDKYLFRVKLNTEGKAGKDDLPEMLSESKLEGTHEYNISPAAKLALHSFSNYQTPYVSEWISLPDNKPLNKSNSIVKNVTKDPNIHVEYFKIETVDSVFLDAWMNKPKDFDPQKKYPLVVYVYGEPGAKTTDNVYGNHDNFLYKGSMSEDGYIQLALDNRGTPSLLGASWRKSIYRRNGQINIRDMAMGVKEILNLPYIDKERVAVWGWSGGGSSTLHLMFQFPKMFKTGIAIAPVTNLLFYDNIYTERYMGLPQENMQDYIKGSALTYAKGLEGNLLLIHGSGDDNVHYSNAEALINELIKYGKQFQFMEYPNRTHNINEGEGAFSHLSDLYTNYLKMHCPPGAK